jgi:Ser/Thr protein kinase RdoA (MazF antagonist)
MMDIVPPSRREAMQTALRMTFGDRTIGPPQSISGGVSGALILRVEVGGRPYLLRLEPERVSEADRTRGLACMASAAAAGVAPAVHYTDAAAGVSIMDFVAARPLSGHPGGPVGVVRELGRLTARLQATAPFLAIGDYPRMIEAMLAALAASGHFPVGALDRHRQGLARIQAAYPWDTAGLVSSHNDPNPRNILFDGQRLWLIDWELAFRNDPLVDLAILATDLAETPELEGALLHAAFGREPGPALRARLGVVRLLTRLFYGCVVLEVFVNAPPFGPDETLAAFTPGGFRQAVADGRLASGTAETAYAFGKMSLAAFLDGLDAPDFDETLAMVAQG